VPLLLRRLRDVAQAWGLEVGRPHRKRRTHLVRKDSLQIAVQFAALREDCGGILVLFDADDDSPRELAPTLARMLGAGGSGWSTKHGSSRASKRCAEGGASSPRQPRTPIRSPLAMLKASWNDACGPARAIPPPSIRLQ
jgi:hypothetical protein